MKKPNSSAAARTIPILPDVLREQHNVNDLDLRGTPLVRIVIDNEKSGDYQGNFSTHLAVINSTKPLCGVKGRYDRNEPIGSCVCAACLVAAGDPKLGDVGGVIHR